jgi:NADH dehydrogenase
MKHVVVIGAGFGGLQAVKKLASCKKIRITLIDKQNHHLFQPLLYQVATAVLSPSDIAIPARSLFAGMENVSVLMAEVTSVDKEKKIVFCGQNAIPYDSLIIAMGAKTGYFGHNEWGNYCIGLKSIQEALDIKKRILCSLEQAELNPAALPHLLNYIIIGGGPTGVEVSGSIAELVRDILKKEFRNIDPAKSKVILIEAGPRLVPTFSEDLSEYTRKELEKRGITVLLNTRVLDINEKGVVLENQVLESNFIIWAAGVEANGFGSQLGVPLDKQKRVLVNSNCAIAQYPDIFVIGDLAAFMDTKKQKFLPGVSAVAMQQGRYVASLIKDELKGEKRKDFVYHDKGMMATIGRKDAIAQVGGLKFKGIIGWLAWLFVHLYYQVGFKNKISILITWFWSYLTLGAGARIIQEPYISTKNKRDTVSSIP